MKLEDAKLLLLSVGIQVGNLTYQAAAQHVAGTILQQRPDVGQQVRIGEHVDLQIVARQEEGMVVPNAPMLPKH
jgi:beta-lactam-binding protein with PASTA domain